MTPEERQRARDRAADAVAGRHEVIVDARRGWPPTARYEPGLCSTERQRRYRASKKARAL